MITRSPNRCSWAAALVLLLAAATTALAQPNEDVTEFSITDPAPDQFTSNTPFRTNRETLAIGFTHNGNTGNYFITTTGADIDGSTFQPEPTATDGSVLAGFSTEGAKTVGLVLLQTRINKIVETRIPANIRYDKTPPVTTLTSLRVGATAAGTGGLVYGLSPIGTAPNDGITERFYAVNGQPALKTRQTGFEVVANVDDAGVCPSAELQVALRVPAAGVRVDTPAATNNIFSRFWQFGTVADGEYLVQVVSNDQVHRASRPYAVATLSPGNFAAPHSFKIILDTKPPNITGIEICRPADVQPCALPAGCMTTGTNTFIGNETVNIKLTFDEPITSPPTLQLQQTGQTAPVQVPPITVINGTARVVQYAFQPVPLQGLNGPVLMIVSGRNAGTNGVNDPGVGTDEAGNGLVGRTLQGVFVVDTVPPDTLRSALTSALERARAVSSPYQGQVVTAETFPEIIRVRVRDYMTADPSATNDTRYASGVDFNQLLPSSGGTGGTTGTGLLALTLTGPAGVVTGGLMSGSEPTEIALNIGTLEQLVVSNPTNFVRDAQDGIVRPIEGLWTISVDLVDKVCNRRTRTITFTVDTTPVHEAFLRVLLGNRAITKEGCCVQATNGVPPGNGLFPDITVTSTEPDFSATSTRFEVLGCINGNDSPCYPAVIPRFTVNETSRIVSGTVTGIAKVDPLGIDFPTPASPVPADTIPAGDFDPRVAKYDGPYTIRIRPSDLAGNKGVLTTDVPSRREDYLDYDINLDTLQPYTQRTFPVDDAFFAAPIRFVDATILDPPARRIPLSEINHDYANPTHVSAYRWVPGCGIDIARSNMCLRIESAYRPNNVDPTLINEATVPIPFTGAGRIRGLLRFVHVPNSTDPTLPSYSPADDRYKMLLEITDKQQNVRTLPTNGNMDGVYSISVAPVDLAGNYMLEPNGISGPNASGNQFRRGTYFGLKTSSTTTRDLGSFWFIYDTIKPKLELDNFPDNVMLGNFEYHGGPQVVSARTAASLINQSSHAATTTAVEDGGTLTGTSFKITGFVSDLSARGNPYGTDTPEKGGAGIDRVEYTLQLVDYTLVPVPPSPSPAIDPTTGRLNNYQVNPIIPLSRATLEKFPYSSNPQTGIDPMPATTEAHGIGDQGLYATWAQVQRPRHRFTIQDTLPPASQIIQPRTGQAQPDIYLFTIRAIDRAGNSTEISRRVTLASTTISAPTPITPRDNSYINSAAAEFSWSSVSGITTYTLCITGPDNVESCRDITGLKTIQSLSKEGKYTWHVAGKDSGGNLGPASTNFTFTVDRTPPRVTSVIVNDTVEPVRRSGAVTLGDVLFHVIFSEEIDSSRPPKLVFQPATISVTPQETTTESLEVNTVLFRGKIPSNAKPKEWDGEASIEVTGAYDKAGNPMSQQTLPTFEIDTGPGYDTRFFFNPVAPQEIIVVLLATEELKTPPRLTELKGLSQISNQAEFVSKHSRAYYSGFTLVNPKVASDVGFIVSGEDLDGNTAKRSITFKVTPLKATAAAKAVSSDGRLSVEVPAGAVTADSMLYILPPAKPTQAAVATQASSLFTLGDKAARKASTVPTEMTAPVDQGLNVLAYLPELGPSGLTFQKAATVVADCTGVALPKGAALSQLGLYVWNGTRWNWVGSPSDATHVSAKITNLGPMALAIDQAAPTVSSVSVADGEKLETPTPTVTAQVADTGSGIVKEGITVMLDDKDTAFSYKEATGEITITPPAPLAPGSHGLAITVRDRAGNATQHAKLSVVAPDGFGLREAVAYPSPAKLFARFRVGLTQPAATSRIKVDIYDVAGHKVRELVEAGPFVGTRQDVDWDLANTTGSGVSSGVYLYRLAVTSDTGQTIKTKGKLAVIR